MDALRHVPKGERGASRPKLVEQAGASWLERLAAGRGFRVISAKGDGYDRLSLPREGKEPILLSTLDLNGTLEVTAPDAFVRSVASGFGRARAFGCGLMLLRRA